jgi:hypothetical protein
MRAFTGGYYRNLMAMYNYLGIRYHWQKFRFEFSTEEPSSGKRDLSPYFIHASDNHECPPPRPEGTGFLSHALELVFVIVCFFWFTACCYMIPTREREETLDGYVRRIWLPRRFITRYLLPLMSAVATCSHQEMLAFPASDVVQYRKLITRQKQYVVSGGVGMVQEALLKGLDIKFRTRVVRIEPRSSGVEVVFNVFGVREETTQLNQEFDQVITAVPPNVVAGIFEPARPRLSQIPIRTLETIVHRVPAMSQRPSSSDEADHILLKTSKIDGGWTEATHLRPDGIAITSCPIAPLSSGHEVLSRSIFTRTMRTTESRSVVDGILGMASPGDTYAYDSKSWHNGDHGVWVVGAWCFDGMVLLEGAVASAMHVGKAFGVEIPWEQGN